MPELPLGFPLRLVSSYQRRTGIWRGRRTTGQTVSSGTLVVGTRLFSAGVVRLPDRPDESTQLGALLCERALRLLARRFDGDMHLADIAGHLSNKEIPIAFVTGHERLTDWDGARLWFDRRCAAVWNSP